MHDTGRTIDPKRDISHHYRPHRGYSGSYHGGNIYNTMGDSMHSQDSGGSGKGKRKGRKGMPRNYSTPGLARAESTGSGGSQRGPQVLLFVLGSPLHTLPIYDIDVHCYSGLQKTDALPHLGIRVPAGLLSPLF